MYLFQPYMQLHFMSVAPIRTQKTTEHIHKGNGVGAVRATQSNSPELLKNILYKPVVEYTLLPLR